MVSNEERREVARKLRERTKKPMGKSMQRMFTETLGIYAHHISWMNPDKATNRWDVIVNYLADLIDRPTCRNIYAETVKVGACENGFKCSECGNIVEDYEGYRISGKFNFCSKCGRDVVE